VPDVLLSGNHREIERYRRKEALRRTIKSRPDLVKRISLSDEDQNLISDINEEEEWTS
jgi:tRNA (guanine37-N1)-methyltransferase